MPRKPEPSLELKKIIWNIAASAGQINFAAIQKQTDYEIDKRRRGGSIDAQIYEDTPDIRTIKRIIEEDLNKLTPEAVVSELPRHVWKLRKDCESIEQLAETTSKLPQKEVAASVKEAEKEHLANILNLTEEWKECLYTSTIEETVPGYHHTKSDIESETLFKCLREHIPSPTLWLNYTIWSDLIDHYLHLCAELMDSVRRDYRFDADNYLTDKEDLIWTETNSYPYHEPIIRRISNKALANKEGEHEIHFGNISFFDDYGEHKDISEVEGEFYGKAWVMYVDDTPVGQCLDKKAAAEAYKDASNHHLNDEDNLSTIRLFQTLKSLELSIHREIEEVLAFQDYRWYTCQFCKNYCSPEPDKQRWVQWTTKSIYPALVDEHFKSLIPTSKELLARLKILLSFRERWPKGIPKIEGNIVDGCFLINPTNKKDWIQVHYSEFPNPLDESKLLHINKPIDCLQAQCLLEHFNQQFPKLAYYNQWYTLDFDNLRPPILRKICSWLENEEFKQYGCYVCWLLKKKLNP